MSSEWIKEPNIPDENFKDYHYCEVHCRQHLRGAAIDYCFLDIDGCLFVQNGEYGSQVNFCPVCGYEAKMKIKM
jgi:hypothetical protein